MCRETFFSHEKVYGTIVADLKLLETEGVEVFPNKTVLGTLVYIAGDNLGSHSLGGFIENFSTSAYFCRHCLVTRSDFWQTDRKPVENDSSEVVEIEEFCEHVKGGNSLQSELARKEKSQDLDSSFDESDSSSEEEVDDKIPTEPGYAPILCKTRTVRAYKEALEKKEA